MPTRPLHPSNLLSSGQVHNFPQAVSCVRAACDAELRDFRSPKYAPTTPEDEHSLALTVSALEDYKAEANIALSVYTEIMEEAKTRTIAELRERGMEKWADALEGDDYAGLAI